MKKNITAPDMYSFVKESLHIGIRQSRIYLKEHGHWTAIIPQEFAIKARGLYSEDDRKYISSTTIKEVMERLIQEPSLQLHFIDEEYECYLNLLNGTYNIERNGIEEMNQDFSYFLNFAYIKHMDRSMETFNNFVSSVFPEETKLKRTLLLEIIGYCISDYTTAKAGFFLIGKSNSGKSVILELISRVLPTNSVTAMPLYRLENRFNLARLAESRINICTEINKKSLSATDIFKIVTSNEVVTAEHKGGKPFEFRLKTKLLNAGNMMPDIEGGEGAGAILNRMIILLFSVSIKREEQDKELIEKLWKERDSIFSEAVDALVRLKERNFIFTEPQDTLQLKKHLQEQEGAIDNFIFDNCICDPNSKEHLVILYDAFKEYCADNLLEIKYSKACFSQLISRVPGVKRGKFRICGSRPLAGIYGLRLKKAEEYNMQDSDRYSEKSILNKNSRNTGTVEQEA